MFFINPLFYPRFPHDVDKPPTLYALMQSMVNYGKDEKSKIKDLAKDSRAEIFDFNYPLSNNVSRETFETNILKHFIMRRIGCETFTAWQIELDAKLNEIMPKYNIMFDAISNWDLFKNGLTIEKIGHIKDIKKDEGESNSKTTAKSKVDSETKMRHSDLPQSHLQDIDNEDYVNIYEKNNGKNESESDSSNKTNDTRNQDTTNDYNETVKHSQADLAKQYIDFQNNVNSIYSMIYKDLDCLFYGLV